MSIGIHLMYTLHLMWMWIILKKIKLSEQLVYTVDVVVFVLM
jgi:hypothetical protein